MVTPTAPSAGSSFLVYSIFQVSIGLLCKLSRRVIKWVSLILVFGQLFFLIVILLIRPYGLTYQSADKFL